MLFTECQQCRTNFPILKQQWSLCSFGFRLCGTVFVPSSIVSSNSLYHPGGKLIHVLGIPQSDLSVCVEILQEFHCYFQLRQHLGRYMKVKNSFKGKKSTSELIFALVDGLSKSNQAFNRSKFMWFVYGVCCFVSSCFCQKKGQCFQIWM